MKKNYILLFLFALLINKSYAQDVGCFDIQTNTVRPICRVIGQPNPSRTLIATPLANRVPRQTTSYTVAPTAFSWRSPDNINDPTNVEADDDWSNVSPADGGPYVQLRANQAQTFNFCFYGEKYNKCMIGDNGVITFNILGDPDSPGATYTPGGYCDWAYSESIPNTNLIRNAIFGVYQDLLPNRFGTPPPAPTVINYFTTGVYPCRAFVANWNEVPLFSGSCPNTLQSYQIVLYETTNIIEVHVRNRTSCGSWNSGNGLIGIQNAAGTAGVTPPGRNTGTWNVTTTEAWRFSPSGPTMPIRYEWADASDPSVILGTGSTLTVAPDDTTTYCVRAYLDGCDTVIPDIPSELHCVTVEVEDPYVGGVMDIRHCDTETDYQIFDIGVNTDLVLGTRSRSDFEVIYYRNLADAEDEINPISWTPNLTTLPFPIEPVGSRSQTLYARVNDYVSECHYEFPFTIRVLDCEIDLKVCDTGNDDVEIIDLNDYRAVIDASNVVDGMNPANYDITYHTTEADALDITTALSNAQIENYEVTTGEEIYIRVQSPTNPLDFSIKHYLVDLRPTPNASISGTTSVCAGSSAPITITGYSGSVVTYTDESGNTLTATLVDDGTGTNTGIFGFSTPVLPEDAVFVYTLVSASLTIDGHTCTETYGTTAVVTAGDLPDAEFVTTDFPICEGNAAAIQILGTPGTQVTYTDYEGTEIDLILDGLGAGTIAVPATLAPNATYTYTLTHITTLSTPPCEQDINDTVVVTVNESPVAALTQIDSQVCLGTPSRVRISGTPLANVTYTLNAGTPQTISLDAAGEYLLTETLPAEGVYDYELVEAASPDAPFCEQPQTGLVSITVIELPDATVSVAAPRVCETSTGTFNFTGTANTTVYYTINGGTEQSIVLTPTTADPLIGEASFTTGALANDVTCQLVRVSTSGTTPCITNLTQSVTIIVNDLPTAAIQANQIICDGTSTTVTITGTPNSIVTYTLNAGANTDVTLNAAGTATINTGTLTADATYRLVSVRFLDVITCSRTLNATSVVRITPLPTATFTADPNICSNRTAEITFAGTPNATVNFTSFDGTTTVNHSIILDGAGNGTFTTTPITATTTFDLVNAVSLASGATPSCTNPIVGSLTITPVAAPIINYSVTPLEVCDDNTDGITQVNFDLKKNEITLGNPGLVVTYHETPQNAEEGFYQYGPIYDLAIDASPEVTPYYVYVRVEEPGGSTCPSLTRFRVIVNRTPQAVSPAAISVCDDASADGFSVFPDLTVREAEMTAALYVADPRAALYSDVYDFEYYLSQPQAEAGLLAGRITSTVSFPNTLAYAQTIWVRVINTSNTTLCFKVVPLQLIVRELPNVAIPAGEYSLCDDDTEDGIRAFDLEDYKTQITTQPGMSVKYYFDDAAVTAGTELPMTIVDGRPQYINQVPVFQTIVVIVTNESQDTRCSIRTTITLRVQPRPFITMPAQIPTECDDDGNGSAVFDLDALKPEISAGADYTITFHETRENAIDNLYVYGQQVDGSGNPVLDGSGNPIPVPYPSLFNGNIWIRATDNVTGCFSIAPLQLIVNPVPVVPTGGILPQLVRCDSNDDQQMRLDLRAHAEAYLLPQPVAGTYVITLHSSSIDANTPSGALIPDTNYPSIDGQIVWVRIENTVSGCYSIASFEVVINPAKYFMPKEFTICDQSLPNDGRALFPSATGVFGDLDSLMTGGLSGYDIIYYRNVADQNALNNPIDKTVPYENEVVPFQNIQVTLIDQVTGCISISRLTLRVQPLPNPKTDPNDIEICDNGVSNTDGIAESVDLTVNETYIRNGASPTSVAFYYYNDINLADTDAAANAISNVGFTNALATPTNYSGPSGTIYVLMTTNPSSTSPLAVKCSVRVEFELIVNPLPALGVAGVIPDYVLCVGGSTATFPLQAHNATVIESGLNVSDYTFTYYDSQINAEGGTAVGLLNNSYTNTANPEEIWVRVVNNATLCVNVGSFELIVDEPAVANPVTNPALITKCDTDSDNDGFTDFDLTTLDSSVLGSQTPGDFTVHYYLDRADAVLDGAEGITTANTRAITGLNPFNTDTRLIYALVINRTSTTGCPDIVPIQLTVNKLPEVIELEGGFFCVDPVTSLPLNTFELAAVVDPAVGNYTYEWTKDGSPYPVPDNTQNPIYVNEAGVYSVVVTNTDTGCVSVPSENATVAPTSNAVAEAFVTGYFTDNATITVVVDGASLGDYEFRLDEGQWQDSNVFSPVATGEHKVYIRDKNDGGCDPLDPITVTVVNYPKYFTPNGDGIHDTWTIAGLGDTARIYIFDRYGKLVKQIASGGEGEGWNGTMNGQPLPSTDYWFKVEYLENNVMKEFKAHFSLKR